jgi:3-keto-5-aminohexanoate cleavage enzyme
VSTLRVSTSKLLQNHSYSYASLPNCDLHRDPEVARDIVTAIRQECPILINMTTGTVGESGAMGGGLLGPTSGPISCLHSTRPAVAALNAGSLNYLKCVVVVVVVVVVAIVVVEIPRLNEIYIYIYIYMCVCVCVCRVKSDGTWAWPPMLFDNPVSKVCVRIYIYIFVCVCVYEM